MRSRCPYARLGVAFYRSRFVYWTVQRGAPIPTWRKPRNCADAKYLAVVWAERSFRSRQATGIWRERQAELEVERLDRVIAGTPMAGQAEVLIRLGKRYHVNPYFVIAVAATESSIGEAACGPGGYNAWGLGNCGSAWSVPAFSSWADAYDYYMRFLNRQWPGHSTPWSFSGYAACDACWARKVSEWMGRFGVAAVSRYP